MSESQELDRLREKAQHIRRSIIEMLAAAGSGHPGGSLSATDLVTCLYFKVMQHKSDDPTWQDRDRFILSKWEIATATAGAILDINPFDEPNVQQAKDATKALLQRVTAEGTFRFLRCRCKFPALR